VQGRAVDKDWQSIMSWFPGWNSAADADWWNSFYFWLGIAFLVLLAISEVASHFYGLRKDELIADADRIATIKREKEQQATETRYQAQAAELKRRTEDAEQTLKRLQQDREPRSLTPEQQTELTNSMRAFRGQKSTATAVLNDDEGKALRDQIAASLVAAGWDHDGPNGMRQSLFTVSPVGVQVTLSKADLDAGRQLTVVQPLIDKLASFGLLQKGIGFVDVNVPSGQMDIIVGRKPTTP
jgi:hypothetical protein